MADRRATSWFEDSPEGLRRLALLLYALVTPGFVAVLATFAQAPHRWSASLAVAAICLAGGVQIACFRHPSSRQWIFPGAVAPVLCCEIAFAATGSLGPGFLAVVGAPVAWGAVLFGTEVVLAGWLTAVIGSFVAIAHTSGWVVAAGNTLQIGLIHGLVAWVVTGKSWHREAARLRVLARDFNDIELVMTLDGRIVDVNDRAVQAYGYSRGELLALNIRHLRRADAATVAGQMRLLNADGALVFEADHFRQDGSSFPVEVSSRLFAFDNDTLVHSLVRDITARRTAQEALQASEERYRLLVNNSALPVIVVSMSTGRILFVNESAARHWGATPETFMSRPGPTFWVHEDQRTAFLTQLRQEGRVDHAQFEIYDARQDVRWVYCSASLVPYGEAVPAALLVFNDITPLKVAERRLDAERAALASESARRRAMFQHTPDGIAITDDRGYLLEANPRFADMLRGSLDALIGRHVSEWDAWQSPADVAVQIDTLRRGRITFETRHRRVDGTSFDVEVSATIIELDGRFVVMGLHRDISERKQLEAERDRLIEQLRDALSHVKELKGMLPMCAWCHKVRTDDGYWKRVEAYLHEQTDLRLSHGICPECLTRARADLVQR